MHLETDLASIEDVTPQQLREELALLNSDTSTRAILSIDGEHYLQTAAYDNGFVIEKREGSEDKHFHAVPDHLPLAAPAAPRKGWIERLFGLGKPNNSTYAFTLTQIEDVFLAYLEGREPDPPLKWAPGYTSG